MKHITSRLKAKYMPSQVWRWVLISLGVIGIVNLGVGAAYYARTYPRSTLGKAKASNVRFSRLDSLSPLPETVEIATSYKQQRLKLVDVGASVDWPATTQLAKQQRSWLPLIAIAQKHDYPVKLSFNKQKLAAATQKIAKDFAVASKDAQVVITGATVALTKGSPGNEVKQAELSSALGTLSTTSQKISVPVQATTPSFTDAEAQAIVAQLQARQKLVLSVAYNGNTKTASTADIASWHSVDNEKLVVSTAKVQAYVAGLGRSWGIQVQNANQLTAELTSSLEQTKSYASTAVAAPKYAKQYTYCVKSLEAGVDYLPGLKAKLASTLNDPRGWSLEGKVLFSEVSSGCSMIVWLSAASLLPTFGYPCDSDWSCTVRPNVILNYDRWRFASDAWNAAGGTLDDYRSMVINHEVGHWLGFGHRFCSGAGQPAPVMQQQSISLQGCTFNPWPTAAERATLQAQLGL